MVRPNRVLKLILALALIVSLSSCVTGLLSSEPVIVERNKETTPTWLGQATEQLLENDSSFSFLSVRTHIQNLPLGIKETQLGALQSSQKALVGKMRDQIERVMVEDQITLTNAKEMESVLERIVRDAHGKSVKVADIYYEKLHVNDAEDDLSDYYRVYVLIELRQLQSQYLMKSIGDNFQASSKSDIKLLGKSVAKRSSKLISH